MNPLFIELYSKIKGKGLRPKAIVRYDAGGFSLCARQCADYLDRNICTGLGSVDFLNPEISTSTQWSTARYWKSNTMRFLPELVRMAVQVPGRQAAACSKYALSRRFD